MRASLIATAFVLFGTSSKAGSLLGADLQYDQVEGLTWSFTVITYTDPFGPDDSPELLVTFDGGEVDTIPRESQTEFSGDCFEQIMSDLYSWQHTFAGAGVYDLKAWKTGRVETMNLPGGMDNALCLSTEIHITAGLVNSSPVFGTPQRISYYLDDMFVHDPQVSDPDGDSLVCWTVFPRGTDCLAILPSYDPEQSTPPGDSTTVDHATDVFRWFHPNTTGIFTVVIGCVESRDGVVIGQVTRDMTICIEEPSRV